MAVTEQSAFNAAEAYARWGRGVHPAGLNYGDCFAYALAQQRACSLLFVGDDFAKTDIASAR
jgi:ribonuclease VapC